MPYFGDQTKGFSGSGGGASTSSISPSVALFGLDLLNTTFGFFTGRENLRARTEGLRMQADLNARIAEINAKIAKERRDFAVARRKERTKAAVSRGRALFGKAGVATEGTPQQVLERIGVVGDLDALAIKFGGDIDIQNELIAASSARLSGRIASTAGRIGQAALQLKTVSSLIESASKTGLLEGK